MWSINPQMIIRVDQCTLHFHSKIINAHFWGKGTSDILLDGEGYK
jgi:hypothetical protein